MSRAADDARGQNIDTLRRLTSGRYFVVVSKSVGIVLLRVLASGHLARLRARRWPPRLSSSSRYNARRTLYLCSDFGLFGYTWMKLRSGVSLIDAIPNGR